MKFKILGLVIAIVICFLFLGRQLFYDEFNNVSFFESPALIWLLAILALGYGIFLVGKTDTNKK